MPLTKDSREFIECLLSKKVEFPIVGALAVSWHGFPRYSGDIDFFVRSGRENALRLMAALEQFGFGSLVGRFRKYCRVFREDTPLRSWL